MRVTMVGLCNLSFHCVIHFLVRPFQKREYTPIVSYLLPFILSSWTHVVFIFLSFYPFPFYLVILSSWIHVVSGSEGLLVCG